MALVSAGSMSFWARPATKEIFCCICGNQLKVCTVGQERGKFVTCGKLGCKEKAKTAYNQARLAKKKAAQGAA